MAIGWLGSKQKHFDKLAPSTSFAHPHLFPAYSNDGRHLRAWRNCRYLDLWKKMGHVVLGTQPRTSSIVLPPLGDRAAHSFLQEVSSAQQEHPGLPVLYHIFR